MIEFFHLKKDIPFMRYGRVTTTISLITFIVAVWALAAKGLNLGVDFTGGTVLEVSYPQAAQIDRVRSAVEHLGYKEVAVQNFGSARDVLIRLPAKQRASGAQLSEQVMGALKAETPQVELKRVEFIGPQVGKELYDNGALALLVVSIGIMAYLALRFQWKFALAGIIANMHDVVIILGCFALFQWEFSLTVLAGVLAVLGYSVNESVVVFDRIRENLRKMRKTEIPAIIDNAITATMSRTVITHAMTQMMVLAMLFLGGEALHYFAVALTIGILFGIYSSVLVASPIVLFLGVSREDFIKPAKQEAEAMV
ncbi:MAG: protein translocase subunit SecF [Hydrogenophilales bacterium CG03_land_8_20_14_0_80_62_28]|nr:MAG: protein-export membrane protein SecF [Hydrogenophilaceae bacterium CG1_02_62_390]PIV22409.1 MAG: protein translocase subunit SecF [Hydrogenophilales bacterium CG03_land_8_20_14_0_80_62_28]PIW39058.1 MAG: protein translocase subunit SecF [Hydrogenophilales bacterium CG15_BIG_FIL_POST_REV_8_21_14_020_62_31]PIW72812.1 MAG: protein translocase subunit SecF [Hydrogenophilales bacterium CG12_big_fil_rev_8_21_14_0_65_61_21]PIX01731.1 MAG: protein translocase subunit SecF [Hydrogenophilales bac